MDGISTVNNNLSTSQLKNSTSLGKEDFLKMLLAQLKNQDPMSPLEGSEFAAQLAQFSSLEQLTNMNSSMQQSIEANYYLTQSINNTMTATLIGKDVKLSGNGITYNGQENTTLGYNLKSDATSLTVKIYDSNGALVKTIENAEMTKGDHKLSWDFTDNSGNKLSHGNYKFEVEAKGSNNSTMSVETFKWGRIDGMRFTEEGSKLLVNGVEYLLSDILEILNGSNQGTGEHVGS